MSEANKGFFILDAPTEVSESDRRRTSSLLAPTNEKGCLKSGSLFLFLLLRQNNPVIAAQVHQAEKIQ